MKPRWAEERGQAFTELALVLFLFFFFLLGVMQLVMIGRAQIQLQHVARRAAVQQDVWNHASVRDQDEKELQALLPGATPVSVVGNRDEGTTVRMSCVVPAIGFFRWVNPNGFTLSCQSAVLAYNPQPKASEILNKGLQGIWDWLSKR
jgi:hypothetical protein